MTSRRDVLCIVTDTHCGSTWALCPPTVELDDGGIYHHSDAQAWLWQAWVNFQSILRDTKPRGGGKRWLIHLGDAMEGDHHETSQLISRNPKTMQQIAVAVLEPLCKWADRRFFLRGTPAHSGKAGAFEEWLADDLAGERDASRNMASWWHLLLDVQGYRIDAAHHPPSGTSLKWARHNPAARLATTVWWDYCESGDKPPHLAVRGHQHRWSDNEDYQVRGTVVAGWKLIDEFVNRSAPGSLPHIGGLIGVIENGEAEWKKIRYQLPRRAAWQEAEPG